MTFVRPCRGRALDALLVARLDALLDALEPRGDRAGLLSLSTCRHQWT